MFEGDSADTCIRKFQLMSMGGRVEGLACADLEARTPIGVGGYFLYSSLNFCLFLSVKDYGLDEDQMLKHAHNAHKFFNSGADKCSLSMPGYCQVLYTTLQ